MIPVQLSSMYALQPVCRWICSHISRPFCFLPSSVRTTPCKSEAGTRPHGSSVFSRPSYQKAVGRYYCMPCSVGHCSPFSARAGIPYPKCSFSQVSVQHFSENRVLFQLARCICHPPSRSSNRNSKNEVHKRHIVFFYPHIMDKEEQASEKLVRTTLLCLCSLTFLS